MKKILMIVDYQNDFVTGALGFKEAKELDDKIVARVKQAHENGEMIICTLDTHFTNYLETQEGRKLPVVHCQVFTNGWDIHGETCRALQDTRYPAATYLEKNTFGAIGLQNILKGVTDKNVQIEICGVVTNMCVISNAVMAKSILPEAEIIINSELCAGPDEYLHKAALDVMRSMQMTII